jgi:hypothetical protein
MYKFKQAKFKPFMYDHESRMATDTSAATRIFPGKVELSDKGLSALACAGKSFQVDPSGSVEVDKTRPLGFLLSQWDKEKGEYRPVCQTGTARFASSTSGRDRKFSIEYAGEGIKRILVSLDYSDLIEAWNDQAYGRDSDSPVYVVSEKGTAQETVLAVVMPMREPD